MLVKKNTHTHLSSYTLLCWLINTSFLVLECVPITLRLPQPLVNLRHSKQPSGSASSALISLFVPNPFSLSTIMPLFVRACRPPPLPTPHVHLAGYKVSCSRSRSTSISSHSNLIINYSLPEADRSPNTVWHSFQGDQHKVIHEQDPVKKKKKRVNLHSCSFCVTIVLLNRYIQTDLITIKRYSITAHVREKGLMSR